MDILSHGLWGGAAFGQKKKKHFWPAFVIGMSPDLFAFTIPFIVRIISTISGNGQTFDSSDPHNSAMFGDYVHYFYNIGHSFVTFALVFVAIWVFRRKPYIPLFAWAIHIFLDIFTHDIKFFPTPFLWPLSDYRFDGISWGTPAIFIPNVICLALVYLGIYLYKRHKKQTA